MPPPEKGPCKDDVGSAGAVPNARGLSKQDPSLSFASFRSY